MINPLLKTQLTQDGYCVVQGVLDAGLLAMLRAHTQDRLRSEPEEKLKANLSLGTLIDLWDEAWLLPLIAGPQYKNLLIALGARTLRYSTAYLFHKFAHNPVTFWHQDWWAWKEALSYKKNPPQLGLLCFLQDTDAENGALRVLPGSHRHLTKLHAVIETLDKKILRQAKDLSSAVFQSQVGEVTVAVNAGDVIVMDARLLHGAHANQTDMTNSLITAWYYPNYDELSPPIQAAIGSKQPPAHWNASQKACLMPLLPQCHTLSKPTPFCEWPK